MFALLVTLDIRKCIPSGPNYKRQPKKHQNNEFFALTF